MVLKKQQYLEPTEAEQEKFAVKKQQYLEATVEGKICRFRFRSGGFRSHCSISRLSKFHFAIVLTSFT